MSKEYWAQVLEFESSAEVSARYKHLENLYKEYWRDRSMLAELNLQDQNHEKSSSRCSQDSKLPSINHSKFHHRRLSSMNLPSLIPSVFASKEITSNQVSHKRKNPKISHSKHSSLSRRSYL
jgi:hypothetical protein